MEHCIQISRHGPPDVMALVATTLDPPGPGEVLVRHQAIAVNQIDLQQRSGQYPLALPTGLGMEAAGLIEAVGPDVVGLKPGDRVVYIADTPGSYATARVRPARTVALIPAGINMAVVAAMFTRGLTAWHLTHTLRRIDASDTIVVHAAGGGVGGLIAQMALQVGAMVIGVVANEDEAEAARIAGCHAVLVDPGPDLASQVRHLADGGASVVYDPIGRDTFEASLDCLRPFGLLVAFGNLSGPISPFAPMQALGRRGSLQIVWPMLKDFLTPDLMPAAVRGLFEAMRRGLTCPIGQTFPLAEASSAHRLIEQRRQKGATVLIP